ncbi:MAG: glycosyltransferase family 4 protein [Chitinophagaceae bacterium]
MERAVMNTANLFLKKGHPVTLVILDKTSESFYPILPGIQVVCQPLSFGITPEGNIITRKIKLLSDVLQLRKILKKTSPACIISSEYPFTVAAILAGGKKFGRVISWEHHHFGWLEKNRFWNFLCNQAYPKLDAIVCLNKKEETYYKQLGPTYIIPNFVENTEGTVSSSHNKNILTVGWLIPRKGTDLLLQAAGTVLSKYPDWTWKLIGEGELKEKVVQFIRENKLEGRLLLQSPVSSIISEEYLHASLFVLASRYEAFPMVLLEAMSSGVPCVSFDCSSGPSDIIKHDIDGILVEKENSEKLAEAISSLIEDYTKRKKMGESAFKNMQQFSSQAIYLLWGKVLG